MLSQYRLCFFNTRFYSGDDVGGGRAGCRRSGASADAGTMMIRSAYSGCGRS